MPELSEPLIPEPDQCVGVIGFGKMGILHSGLLNLLNPGCVKFIVEKNRMVSLGASRLLKRIKFYGNTENMLKKEEPDIVYVTTPPSSHFNIVSTLLKAGIKMIFVEKPPTLNSEELETLIELKEPEQCVLVGLQKRFSLPVRHARLLLSEKKLGELEEVTASIRSSDVLEPTHRYTKIRRGVLLDLGIHVIDLLQWFLNVDRPIEASSDSFYTGIDDCFKAEISGEDDLKISFTANWSDPAYRRPETLLEFIGTEGEIRVSEDYLKLNSRNQESFQIHLPHYYGGVPPVNLADPEYTLENLHVLHAAMGGVEPITSLDKVRGTMMLVDELYEKTPR